MAKLFLWRSLIQGLWLYFFKQHHIEYSLLGLSWALHLYLHAFAFIDAYRIIYFHCSTGGMKSIQGLDKKTCTALTSKIRQSAERIMQFWEDT